jgi:hypothetical protein
MAQSYLCDLPCNADCSAIDNAAVAHATPPVALGSPHELGRFCGTVGTGASVTLLTDVGLAGLAGSSLRASKLLVDAKRTVLLVVLGWAFYRADFSSWRTLALLQVLTM